MFDIFIIYLYIFDFLFKTTIYLSIMVSERASSVYGKYLGYGNYRFITRAGSLNCDATTATTAVKKKWIFKSCSRITRESPDALNDQCWWYSSDSEVVQESPRESLFKDRYFVRGIGISSGIGSCIAKWFKDPAKLHKVTCDEVILKVRWKGKGEREPQEKRWDFPKIYIPISFLFLNDFLSPFSFLLFKMTCSFVKFP